MHTRTDTTLDTDLITVMRAPLSLQLKLLEELQLLTKLQTAPKQPITGICHRLYTVAPDHCPAVGEWMGEHFPTWEHYSGNLAYPVPATTPGIVNPAEEYDTLTHKWEGRQGLLRQSLSEHLARALERGILHNWAPGEIRKGEDGLYFTFDALETD